MVRTALVVLTLFTMGLFAAACSSRAHSSYFLDEFNGEHFPDNGWTLYGPPPVVDTTTGAPAPSLTWTACPGTNGAAAVINENFYSAQSFDAKAVYEVYGASISSGSGLAFHIVGDFNDDITAYIFPPPDAFIALTIDGNSVEFPAPADHVFHRLEASVNSVGNAGWLLDGQLVLVIGPLPSTTFQAELDCGSGDAGPGRIPILIDNVEVQSHASP